MLCQGTPFGNDAGPCQSWRNDHHFDTALDNANPHVARTLMGENNANVQHNCMHFKVLGVHKSHFFAFFIHCT